MTAPIFYDVTGKRRRWSMRGVFALLVLTLVTAATFAMTVVDLPVPAPLSATIERPHARPLAEQLSHISHKIAKLGNWLPGHASPSALQVNQLKVGFYVPWDDTSGLSLRQHLGDLDWVVPSVLSVNGADHRLIETPDAKFDAIMASAPSKLND